MSQLFFLIELTEERFNLIKSYEKKKDLYFSMNRHYDDINASIPFSIFLFY